MSVRYYVQCDGEETPRGPLPVGAVRKLFDNGDITGGSAVCQEGDSDWLTLDDYWVDIMPPAAPAARPAYAAGAAVHPALAKQPVELWRIVFGVMSFISAFTGFAWGLVYLFGGSAGGAIVCGLGGAFWMWLGFKLTRRK